MERRAKVELFEEIRREHEFGNGTIKGVALKLGVHRRMVRQALANAQPPERRRGERERLVVGPLIAFINAILEADRQAPRKQRHTAHRIWQRIRTEMAERKVAEVTIRQYVRERKRELGWVARATKLSQSKNKLKLAMGLVWALVMVGLTGCASSTPAAESAALARTELRFNINLCQQR